MSALTNAVDKVKSTFFDVAQRIKVRLIGANNERLDLLMDSFYKLSPPQRTGVVFGLGAVIAVLVFGAVVVYFDRINALKNELSDSFNALHELQTQKMEFQREEARFQKLNDVIVKKTQGLRIKPALEAVAKDTDVTMEGLTEQKVPLPGDNPLSKKIQEVKADMRFTQISVPRLLKFLVAVEKSDKLLSVQELQIRGRYGTKLYFEVQTKVRGYVPLAGE